MVRGCMSGVLPVVCSFVVQPGIFFFGRGVHCYKAMPHNRIDNPEWTEAVTPERGYGMSGHSKWVPEAGNDHCSSRQPQQDRNSQCRVRRETHATLLTAKASAKEHTALVLAPASLCTAHDSTNWDPGGTHRSTRRT